MPRRHPITRFEPMRKPVSYFLYLVMVFGLLALSALVMRLL